MTVSTFQAFSFGEEGVGVIHRLSLPSLDFPVQVPLKKKTSANFYKYMGTMERFFVD